jgi:8-oxo-dGTP diphosphatase
MTSFILFIIAIVIVVIFFPIGFLFQLLWPSKRKYWKIKTYLLQIAIGLDQLGNIVCANLLNHTLINKPAYLFGDEDETISSVIGKNKKIDNLSLVGRGLDYLLDKLDRNHSINSIEIEP